MGSPVFTKRISVNDARLRKLKALVAKLGVQGTARALRCSTDVVTELATGGGVTPRCAARVGEAIDAAEVGQ